MRRLNFPLLLFVLLQLTRIFSRSRHDNKKNDSKNTINLPKVSNQQTGSIYRHPHIFLIGAQKGGTSSLHVLLGYHKKICGEGLKEKHYFDDHPDDWNQTYYHSLFSMCSYDQLSVDSTPYFGVWRVPELMNATYPRDCLRTKKFILVLREPVTREFSNYQHRIRECSYLVAKKTYAYFDYKFAKLCCSQVMPSFQENVTTTFNPLTFREFYMHGKIEKMAGRYKELIAHWLSVVNREQLFIVNFDHLVARPADVMNRLRLFLNVRGGWGANVSFPVENISSHIKSDLDCETYDELYDIYSQANANLVSMINNDPNKPKSEPTFRPFPNTRSKCKSTFNPDLFEDYIG